MAATEPTAAAKFTIGKAQLTVTANDKTVKFGEGPSDAGVTYSGFKGNDSERSLSGTLSYSYGDYAAGKPAGAYPIVPSGLSAANYDITYAIDVQVLPKGQVPAGYDSGTAPSVS